MDISGGFNIKLSSGFISAGPTSNVHFIVGFAGNSQIFAAAAKANKATSAAKSHGTKAELLSDEISPSPRACF